MIPVRLELRDFLSYADPEPIDFTGFEVACLTGRNAAGKSSLLDAMTFGLFGAARGSAGGRNTDRLIREGCAEACVAFTFELGAETYRITRKRPRSGTGELRFEVQTKDGWTNLAADSVRETDARIARTLRMDYRSFTASAFFVQGRADDFLARMDAAERREVFARLLDLGTYEALCDAARASMRDAERERAAHGERIEALRPEADRLEAVRTELAAAATRLEAAEKAVAEGEKRLEELRERTAELERTEARADAERQALAALEDRLVRERGELGIRREELATVDALLDRSGEVDTALAEAARVRAAEEQARVASDARACLEQRRTELAGRIDAARRETAARRDAARTQAAKLTADADALERNRPALAEIEERLTCLGDVTSSLEELETQLDRLRTEDAALGAEMKTLDARIADATERLGLLSAGEGTCPVCGGDLDPTHRTAVVKQVRREQRELSKALDERSGRREVVRKEGKRLREEAERLKRTGAELQQAQTDAAALRAHLEALPKLREEARTLLERAAADDALLTAAGADTEELAAVTEQLARIVYDSEEHARLRARLEELSLYAEVKGRLEEASGRRSRLTEDIATLTDRLEAEDRQASERRDALAALATQLEALPGVREDVANSRRVLDESRATAQEAGRERVRLTEEAARLERTAADLAAATRAEQEAAARHRVHTRLAQAFGRGGIPDRIIENALPELTHEANEFLGRLSDYEMSVQFILDKPTKSGSVRETFDVLVNHDGGVRDFQMFSGGEAFRIAFAIRLGLSKLLVRRAGARLETLVIDEGFGTQDPEGRERLVEAINLARREFAKVLVITHLDELKDVFGTQLRVTKDTPQGSRVEFVGA